MKRNLRKTIYLCGADHWSVCSLCTHYEKPTDEQEKKGVGCAHIREGLNYLNLCGHNKA